LYGRRRKKLNTVKNSDISTNIQSDTSTDSSTSKRVPRKSSGGCGCGGKRTKKIKEE